MLLKNIRLLDQAIYPFGPTGEALNGAEGVLALTEGIFSKSLQAIRRITRQSQSALGLIQKPRDSFCFSELIRFRGCGFSIWVYRLV